MFESWEALLYFGVTIAVGFLGVPLTQFLKSQFNLTGKAALLVTALVAGTLAVVQLLVTGAITPAEITLENFPAVFGIIFTAGTIYYKLLVSKPEPLPEV